MPSPQRICVVVPTYNEKENISKLIEEVKQVGVPGLHLLFVDDSSPDGTGESIRGIAVQEPWVHLLVRDFKLGIGSAYLDGFRKALSSLDPEVLVEMDADLQHPPAVLNALLAAIAGGADVAVASRYVPGGGVSEWKLRRRIVSKGANAYARVMLGLPVRDATSGFRAYSRRAAERVAKTSLPSRGFEFQVASLHLLKADMKIVEVPFTFSSRVEGKSKLGLRDMARFFVAVLKISLDSG